MQPGPIDDGTRRFADESVMGTDSNPYAAIVLTVALKRRILLASLIWTMKIGLILPIANHARSIFS